MTKGKSNKMMFARIKSPLLVCVLLLSVTSIQAADRPNVIFILADDFGIGNVSCYGSDNYKTPNIDKLASSGTRFTRAFTGALCGPSRAP